VSRHLAATGYGAIELAGASDELVVLHVRDDGVEFEAVPGLAGATVSETTDYLDDEHDIPSDRTAVIGPAGENEVRFASSIMTTEERAFGRAGLGAVLGSKNVKAVTFGGDSAPDLSINATANEIHREAATEDHIMKEQGTVAVMDLANEMDGLPSYYFSERSFAGVEGINGAAVAEKKYKKGTCSSCAFACKLPTRDGARRRDRRPRVRGGDGVRLELGSRRHRRRDGVEPPVRRVRAGRDLRGQHDRRVPRRRRRRVRQSRAYLGPRGQEIAQRDGVGDQLAEGIGRIHDDLGVGNWSVKNMDFAAHEGRLLHGQALSYAVANRGADHMYATFYSVEYPSSRKRRPWSPPGSGKAERLVQREDLMALNDSGVVCKFSRDFMTPERYELLFDADFEVARGGCTDRDAGASLQQQPARDRRRRRPAPVRGRTARTRRRHRLVLRASRVERRRYGARIGAAGVGLALCRIRHAGRC